MLIEQTRKGMGTVLAVHVEAPPDAAAAAQRAIVACFAWLAEVETRLTRFDDASELCHLNAAAGEWRAVSALCYAAVEQAITAARASDGLFDPTLLARLMALGYDRDYAAITRRETAEGSHETGASSVTSMGATTRPRPTTRQTSGAWRAIALDPARRRIRLPRGCQLDLGGIAKGWAADEALQRCFADHPNVIVDVGGDMRVRGVADDGRPWPIGVGATREAANQPPPDQPVVALRQGAIATSGANNRWWYRNGRRQHHLLDPRTGQSARVWISDDRDDANDQGDPATLIAAATALAPTAAHAEVAAKVALLRGFPQALRSVEAAWDAWLAADADGGRAVAPYRDAGVALILTLGSGEVVASSNIQAYLETLGGGGDIWLS